MMQLLIFSLSLAGLALVAEFIQMLRTPRRPWFTPAGRTPEQMAKDEQAIREGRAILVPARRKDALKEMVWALLVAAPLAGFFEWAKQPQHQCIHIFGVTPPVFLLNYLLPFYLLIPIFLLARDGVEILRTGYSPPISRPQMQDVVAYRGKISMLRGCFLIFGTVSLVVWIVFSEVVVHSSGVAGGATKPVPSEANCVSHQP